MRTLLRRVVAVLAPLATAAALLPAAPAQAAEGDNALHLVTLRPGTSTQVADTVLDSVGAPEPTYRWSHALDGFAVRLTSRQANDLRSKAAVDFVESDRRQRVASAPASIDRAGSPYAGGRGGSGTVIGIVDTGLWPDSPLFAARRGLGSSPVFSGTCTRGPGWPSSACNGKIAAAQWFVSGFGEENLRSNSSLSARDDSGHGTQVASLAAGNSGVSVDLAGRPAGVYSGVAPRARVAVYKACWSAPDPVNDGCSSADLVAAIDQAVADRVDVLNLSVAGSQESEAAGTSTVERALLGAAESDIAVVAAAGNTDRRGVAAYPSPWVTTVGGLNGAKHQGDLQLTTGLRLTGAMLSPAGTGRVQLIRASDAAAAGATHADARLCRPGSLDAGAVAGTVVVCERGGLGRIDKSETVKRADGVGMVLLNERTGRDNIAADLHAVPTVHLDRDHAAHLRRQLAKDEELRARLVPADQDGATSTLLPASPPGDPTAGVLKPDVVAPADGLLGAVPPSGDGDRWNVLSGTSAAAAQVSGLAARLRSDHPAWSAAAVRSSLTTATTPVPGKVARTGSGRASAATPGLVFEVGERSYRRYLSGSLASSRLNTASVIVRPDHARVTRTVTNRSGTRRTWTASVTGFDRHTVTVAPQRITLDPGESRDFTVLTRGAPADIAYDGGFVTWKSPGRANVRVPVLMGR